jgi:hypothetical protein
LSDLDHYHILIAADQVNLRFDIKLEAPCDLEGLVGHLRLLSPAGDLLEESTYVNGQLGIFDWVPRASGEVIIEVSGALASRGVYLVSITERDGGAYIPVNDRVCLNDADCQCDVLRCDAAFGNTGSCLPRAGSEIEPNDEPNQARVITRDANRVGVTFATMAGEGDQDYFRVEVGEEDLWRDMKFEVQNLCDQPDPPQVSLTIYAPNGAVIRTVSGDADSPSPQIQWWRPTQIGPHLLKVAQLGREGDYMLSWSDHMMCNPQALDAVGDVEVDDLPCGCADRYCPSPADQDERLGGDEIDQASNGCVANPVTLSIEREPNDLSSLASQVCDRPGEFCNASHADIQGHLKTSGDLDLFWLNWTAEQQGALFTVRDRAYCRDAHLPLRVELVRDDSEWVLARGAEGRALAAEELPSEAVSHLLSTDTVRAFSPGRYTLRVQRDVNYSEITTETGGYVVELREVTCEQDADCLCADVACVRGVCRTQEHEREPNNTFADAQSVLQIDDLTQPLTATLAASLEARPDLNLFDTDSYLLDLSGVALDESGVTLQTMLRPLCESDLPPHEVMVYRETGELLSGEVEQVELQRSSSAEGESAYAHLTISARYWVTVRSVAESSGAYMIDFMLETPESP